jgi:hypothetical protein
MNCHPLEMKELMPAAPPKPNKAAMSAAFTLVFCQGRSPPSCPAPHDTDLLNRIRDKIPNTSPVDCRDALIRIQRLSHDVYEVCGAVRDGEYGTGKDAQAMALSLLEEKCPGLTEHEYRTAFTVGMIWTAL